ncbi:WhiB family transcriptional regulator, partial [Streptomyces sp. NPDC059083]|uniref:WhiB family transcriptional regulator n=1 Tax=Streptomyces sp. NPDC059083 TaxID=3346721 RepID=UPI0036BAB5B3
PQERLQMGRSQGTSYPQQATTYTSSLRTASDVRPAGPSADLAAKQKTTSSSGHPGVWAAAACLDVPDPDLFFPDRWNDAREAQLVCGVCPLLAQCAEKFLLDPIFGGVVASVPLPPLYADRKLRVTASKELARIAAGGAPLLQPKGRGPIWRNPDFQIRVFELRMEVGLAWAEIANQLKVTTDTARRALAAYSDATEGLVA